MQFSELFFAVAFVAHNVVRTTLRTKLRTIFSSFHRENRFLTPNSSEQFCLISRRISMDTKEQASHCGNGDHVLAETAGKLLDLAAPAAASTAVAK
jgi:hypothetical protein